MSYAQSTQHAQRSTASDCLGAVYALGSANSMDEPTKKRIESLEFQLNQQAEQIRALTNKLNSIPTSIAIPNWGLDIQALAKRVTALEDQQATSK